MKSHRVPAIGRPAPLRGFAGDGDLVIAVARLIADHGGWQAKQWHIADQFAKCAADTPS